MRRFAVVFCLLATAWASPVAGQDAGAQRQQLEQRVRRAFQNRVRQDLQLTAAEVPQLTEVIRWSEGLRRGIALRTRELNTRAVDFLREGGAESEAVAILEERKALQREESDLFAEEQERLLDVLSPNQVVRYYRLRDQFNRQLQRARARRPGNRGENS
jgi:hypothetical protein